MLTRIACFFSTPTDKEAQQPIQAATNEALEKMESDLEAMLEKNMEKR